jgi:photosystem II stability/assembly factor-like uncharacterized protein
MLAKRRVETKAAVAPAESAGATGSSPSVPETTPAELSISEKDEPSAHLPLNAFDGAAFALATSSNMVLAATSRGLLSSPDSGVTWSQVPGVLPDDWRFVSAADSAVVIATLHSAMLSLDSGLTWKPLLLPEGLTQIGAIAVQENGIVWIGGREGIYSSVDNGGVWTTPKNLFLNGVSSIYYDEPNKRLLITAKGEPTVAFTLQLPEMHVAFHETGWNLRFVRPEGDHLVGATMFDGIVVQPRMVASPIQPLTSPAQPASTPAGAPAGKE